MLTPSDTNEETSSLSLSLTDATTILTTTVSSLATAAPSFATNVALLNTTVESLVTTVEPVNTTGTPVATATTLPDGFRLELLPTVTVVNSAVATTEEPSPVAAAQATTLELSKAASGSTGLFSTSWPGEVTTTPIPADLDVELNWHLLLLLPLATLGVTVAKAGLSKRQNALASIARSLTQITLGNYCY